MNVSLYQAAAAMNANARWQEVISENLSSSSIPGYKKQDLSFSAIQSGLMDTGEIEQTFQKSLPLPAVAGLTNFTPGQLAPSGNPTDVGIEGRGFFEVQLPNGATAYTRDGEFQLNSQGQLVNKQGYPVLGESGPIQFDPSSSAPIQIAASGEITQGGDERGKLKIVDFQDPQLLTTIGGGCFLAQDAALVPIPANGTVRQAFLEASNATPSGEMVNLISSMRMFEANQRVIQTHDEHMGKIITELGNPN
jgi:flagellar basal body rod protein FlgG